METKLKIYFELRFEFILGANIVRKCIEKYIDVGVALQMLDDPA